MTVSEIRTAFFEQLDKLYNQFEIRSILFILLEHYFNWNKTEVQFRLFEELDSEKSDLLKSALSDLKKGKPVQHITGWAWFDNQRFKVTSDVLVPRQETEQLCQIVRSHVTSRYLKKKPAILDIGTGSGCIAINLKINIPEATITAIDNSCEALKVARENALLWGCDIEFRQTDIFNQAQWKDLGTYDIIVSNPPYVTYSEAAGMHSNVLTYEPAGALFVPDSDPLIFYRTILLFCKSLATNNLDLFFEINERFGDEMKDLTESMGFQHPEIIKDIHGKDRFLCTHLTG